MELLIAILVVALVILSLTLAVEARMHRTRQTLTRERETPVQRADRERGGDDYEALLTAYRSQVDANVGMYGRIQSFEFRLNEAQEENRRLTDRIRALNEQNIRLKGLTCPHDETGDRMRPEVVAERIRQAEYAAHRQADQSSYEDYLRKRDPARLDDKDVAFKDVDDAMLALHHELVDHVEEVTTGKKPRRPRRANPMDQVPAYSETGTDITASAPGEHAVD